MGIEQEKDDNDVAPFAGAWIEITFTGKIRTLRYVAPFAGAWIEIPSWGKIKELFYVAPFAGAWIEMIGLICNAG